MFNTLSIERLRIITRNGDVAYDELFHPGVNIIRGNNSSGKSTVTNFIFFVLGGEFIDFVPEAKSCEFVYAQTKMNGATITLLRQLELDDDNKIKRRTPIKLFWGNLAESLSPPPDKHWEVYGYNSYPEKRSFSNVIFDNLNIPTVRGEGNITVHQILRLLYIDQDSPTGSLFLYEQFDSQITRETTADLLLGVYDEELYDLKRLLIDAQKRLVDVAAEIRATKGMFENELLLVPGHIEAKIDNSKAEIAKAEEAILSLKSETQAIKIKVNDFAFVRLNEDLVNQRKKVATLKDDLKRYSLEVIDNKQFLESLSRKKQALQNSATTRAFLKNFPLDFCPDCLTDLEVLSEADAATTCRLCKSEINPGYGLIQARRLEQEITNQIIESRSIQERVVRELEQLQPSLTVEERRLKDLQKQFDAAVTDVKSSSQERLEELYTQKGYLEGEISQFQTMLENALYYQSLKAKKTELDTLVAITTRNINIKDILADSKRSEALDQIRKEAVYLLRNDFQRQDDFNSASDFHVDFANNMVFLSNKYERYSASSNFYLKLTARFAIFLASLTIESMRYPRFILADNMEDKGIEKERAQNFQKILIDHLSSVDPNAYQVIYTTSYITPELNDSSLVVGDFYTAENRTLKHV